MSDIPSPSSFTSPAPAPAPAPAPTPAPAPAPSLSPTLSLPPPVMRATQNPPSPARRWPARLRTLLHLRPSSRRRFVSTPPTSASAPTTTTTAVVTTNATPAPATTTVAATTATATTATATTTTSTTTSSAWTSTAITSSAPAAPSAPAPRPRRRTRRRNPSPADASALYPARTTHASALRYRRPDMDLPVPILRHPAPPDHDAVPPTVLAPPSALRPALSSPLADLDSIEERDLFAVFHRLFDEYSASAPSSRSAHDVHPAAAPLYLSSLPPHARHRVAMRVHNAYYIAGSRRPARLTTELERDFRWSVRTLTFSDTSHASYDYAASDDQIEALPTFVMEKGETRSVPQIFASMGDHNDSAAAEGHDPICCASATFAECAICLSDFEPGDEITLLPCGHFFHLDGCVKEWLRNHARTCPTCRADICSPTGSSDGLASHSATVGTTEEVS